MMLHSLQQRPWFLITVCPHNKTGSTRLLNFSQVYFPSLVMVCDFFLHFFNFLILVSGCSSKEKQKLGMKKRSFAGIDLPEKYAISGRFQLTPLSLSISISLTLNTSLIYSYYFSISNPSLFQAPSSIFNPFT